MVRNRSLPLVIVNPMSRGGAGSKDWPFAATALHSHFGPFERHFTTGPGEASLVAQSEAESGRRLLLTFGGDGTISETARGIIASKTNCELGVLPHGTGGDFFRSLSIPKRFADAARSLRKGRSVAIDAGRINFNDGNTTTFVNSASFGLSGLVSHRVHLSQKTRFSYARETLTAALSFEFPEVELKLDNSTGRHFRITNVSLHNGRFFGGGMQMAPSARLQDGKLQLVVVKRLPAIKLISYAPTMYFGAHLKFRAVQHRHLQSLEARPMVPASRVLVEADGECPGQLPARFEVQPKALLLRLPS